MTHAKPTKSFQQIKAQFGRTFHRGDRVTCAGRPGTIVGVRFPHVFFPDRTTTCCASWPATSTTSRNSDARYLQFCHTSERCAVPSCCTRSRVRRNCRSTFRAQRAAERSRRAARVRRSSSHPDNGHQDLGKIKAHACAKPSTSTVSCAHMIAAPSTTGSANDPGKQSSELPLYLVIQFRFNRDFSQAMARAPSLVIAHTCTASRTNTFGLHSNSSVISIMPLAASRFAAETSAASVSHRGGGMRPIRSSNWMSMGTP